MGPGGVAEIQQQHRGSDGQERVMLERRLGDRAVAEECLMPYALRLMPSDICLMPVMLERRLGDRAVLIYTKRLI